MQKILAKQLRLWVQLETVYVLEGLGPPKEQAAASRTFADQASVLPEPAIQL